VTIPKLDPNSFFGNISLRLEPDNYTIETLDSFGFKDSRGLLWDVPKGMRFTGAAIPRTMWSLFGGPFTGEYTVSSVLLEHHSTLRTRSYEEVQNMFFESLLKSNVDAVKAKIFYTAIKTFGPRWNVPPSAEAQPGNNTLLPK
jgi:hypothetical protein